MEEYNFGIASSNHVNLVYNGDNYSDDKCFTYKFETDRRLNDKELKLICSIINGLIEWYSVDHS